MSEKKFALVRLSDGWVWNVCVWDGSTPWNHLPIGIEAIQCPSIVSPGWFYLDDQWTPPEPPIEG